MNLKKEEKYILIGIPFIIIAGSILHFIYDWLGKNKVIGLFVPVNESVWEHTKLFLLPVIIWWMAYYIINKDKDKINPNKWFFGCIAALVASVLFMICFYYAFTQFFGFDSIIFDVADFILSVIVGQLAGIHFYRKPDKIDWKTSFSIIILIVSLFAFLTLCPPKTPIFFDNATKIYGYT